MLQQSTSLSESVKVHLNIFPNPVQEKLIIETNIVQDVQFTIYSNTGKIIKSDTSKQESRINIDVRDFSPGVYYLQFQIEGQIINRKIIKT